MTRRRILILNERDPEHPRAGGAEKHVFEIFSRLAHRGHRVVQYSTGFDDAPAGHEQTRGGIDVERVGPLFRYYASVPARLRRARREEEFDVIVDCLNKIPFYSPLHVDTPTLALCHHLFGEVAFSQVSWPVACVVWLCERGLPRIYRGSPFVAISESTRDDLVARGIDASQIIVSHPGIDPPRRTPDFETPRPRRVTYLGRLEAYKRVDLLFEAAARLVHRFPDLEIVVIGRGPEREPLERLAARLNLGTRTQFAGFVSDDRRDALLASTRVCVFPSEKEGWGLSVIEANAMGTPVVASDVPGLRDSVQDGVTGRLVRHGDSDELASALAPLLEDSRPVEEMRRAAHLWSQGFDWERAADDMEGAIERAIRISETR